MTGTITIERDGPLGRLIIDRPERRNALDTAMWEAFPEAVAVLDRDPQVRVILLRGAGTQAFAAGADIAELEAMGTDTTALAAFEARFERAQASLEAASRPVIAAISGACMGGGLALALACDMRIAAQGARFAIPAARLGLGYAAPAVARLLRTVGPAHACAILATGTARDADEALRIGLVNEVVADDVVFAHAEHVAATIAANAPLTVTAAKAAIHALLQGGEALRQAEEMIARCAASADFEEGRRAFVERRPPRFTGR